MSAEPKESLQKLIDVAEGQKDLNKWEFREIMEDLETRKKYNIREYNMICTSENVVVVCDMETEEYIQIEIPIEDEDEIIITRDV